MNIERTLLLLDIGYKSKELHNLTLSCVLIEQLISADTADQILSSDWLVSLKLCSDWLSEPLKNAS